MMPEQDVCPNTQCNNLGKYGVGSKCPTCGTEIRKLGFWGKEGRSAVEHEKGKLPKLKPEVRVGKYILSMPQDFDPKKIVTKWGGTSSVDGEGIRGLLTGTSEESNCLLCRLQDVKYQYASRPINCYIFGKKLLSVMEMKVVSYPPTRFDPLLALAPSESSDTGFYFGVVKLSRGTDVSYRVIRNGEMLLELYSDSALLGGAYASVSHLVVASDAKPYEAQQRLKGKLFSYIMYSKGVLQKEIQV